VEDNHRGGLTAVEAVLKYLDANGISVSEFIRLYAEFVARADVGIPYERNWLPRGVNVEVEEKNLMAKLTAPLHYCEESLCKTDFGQEAKERMRKLTWNEYVQRRAEVASSAVGGAVGELRKIYGSRLSNAEYADLAHHALGPADVRENTKLALKLAYGLPAAVPRVRHVHVSPIDGAVGRQMAELAGAMWVRHMALTASRFLEGVAYTAVIHGAGRPLQAVAVVLDRPAPMPRLLEGMKAVFEGAAKVKVDAVVVPGREPDEVVVSSRFAPRDSLRVSDEKGVYVAPKGAVELRKPVAKVREYATEDMVASLKISPKVSLWPRQNPTSRLPLGATRSSPHYTHTAGGLRRGSSRKYLALWTVSSAGARATRGLS